MHRCEIAVSIRECGINGDGFVVASDGRCRVADFLEGVAEIGIGVGESGLDSNRLAVMLQRLVKTTLLLQHGGQVAVGGGEFRVNLKSFLVKSNRFRDLAAFALDVGLRRQEREERTKVQNQKIINVSSMSR